MKVSIKSFYSFFLIFIWFLITVLSVTNLGDNAMLLLWVGVLGFALIRKPRFDHTVRTKSLPGIWFVFLLYVLFSTALNWLINRDQTLISYMIEYVKLMIIPWMAICAVCRVSSKEKVIVYFRNIVLVCCLLGIFEYVFKVQFYSRLITSADAVNNFATYGNVVNSLYSYRTTLVFYHPIFYCMILAVGMICLIYYPFKSKWIQMAAFLLVAVNMLLTKSRSGWLALGAALVIWFFKEKKYLITRLLCNRKKRNAVLKYLLIICIMFSAVMVVRRDLFTSMLEIIAERVASILDGTGAGARISNLSLVRIAYAQGDWKLILFGGGRYYAQDLLEQNPGKDNWINAVDNQYLTFLLDYGIIGILLIALVYIFAFRLFIRSAEKSDKAACLIIITVAIGSLFFEFFNQNTVNYIFMIAIALLTGSSAGKSDESSSSDSCQRINLEG